MTAAGDLSVASDPSIGLRYEVRESIASGGFARVFKALQRATGQEVAVKVLRLEAAADAAERAEQIDRFRREMRLCAELHHPNIVPLVDSGETRDGGLYAVFAFVPGWNLGDVLAAEGSLDPREALHFMTQVIDAISCAHAKGIVHRDLKPGNIMISSSGARRNAVVLDFGLGTVTAGPRLREQRPLTRRGDFLGTPLYSAPEQLRGEPPALGSDLYSWGLIFLECLTGEPALGSVIPHEIVHRHLSPDPIPIPPPLRSHELGRVLRLATEKDVRRRNASASEILTTLQRCEREDLPSREAIAQASRLREPRQSHRVSARTRESRRELSPLWLVPLGRNPNFTGRDELLLELGSSLKACGLLAVVALHGLGGVGKTQLALEYTYRYSDHYQLVVWIRAEAPETLAADYAAIASALGTTETPDERQKVDAVRSWLERNGRWLLVFDNAPNPEAIRAYLPRSHSGHVLVTSRHQSWRDLAASLTVEVLDRHDAVEFLLKRTGETNAEAAAELCEELGRLPLALEEAAAYLEATGRSITTYLPLLRRHQRRVLFGAPLAPGRAGELRTTWEISFSQVEREAPDASDLLKLCAFLAPDDVSLGLFRLGAKQLRGELGKRLCDELSLDACVAELRRYSLVKAERDALSIHRLVQFATRERMTEPERADWIRSALAVVEAAYPQSATAGGYSPDAGRFLPHALAVLSHAAPYTSCPDVAARLLRRTGIYLSARALHERACEHLEQALGLFESAQDPDFDQIAGALWELGMVLYALGEVYPARDRLERALAIRERHRGKAHILVAQDLLTLAWVQRTLGEFESTLSGAARSLEIMQGILGADHPALAMPLSVMGRALWNLNRIGEARACAERALAALSRAEDTLHPLICGTWYHLAQIQLDLGEFARALECAERGISIGERAYGLDHQLVSTNVCVRGAILERTGDLPGARRCFERALASGQRMCRHLHEDIAISHSELGNVLRLLGDLEGARSNLEHALEGSARLCGDRARYEGRTRVALALLERDLGDLAAARAHCESGLETLEARYGARHPLRIPALNALGWITRELGSPARSRESFAAALEIAEAAALVDHPDHAESLEGLGVLCADQGDRGEARAHLARSLSLLERRLGPEHSASRRVRARLEDSEGG